ncbi:MAG: hypothetical protein LBM05_00850, partial [Endomicrobium sp.]|nr:hypothetical protein [Endomicrobium sp.]
MHSKQNRFDNAYNIISNVNIKNDYFKIKILINDIVQYCSPGQFFMFNIPGNFLRRPFSIHD